MILALVLTYLCWAGVAVCGLGAAASVVYLLVLKGASDA